MTSLTDSLEKLRLWTEIDVKSPNTKNTILRKISADTKNPFQFDMDFYQQHKERYSMLGQTNLELLQLSKPWRVNLKEDLRNRITNPFNNYFGTHYIYQ